MNRRREAHIGKPAARNIQDRFLYSEETRVTHRQFIVLSMIVSCGSVWPCFSLPVLRVVGSEWGQVMCLVSSVLKKFYFLFVFMKKIQ